MNEFLFVPDFLNEKTEEQRVVGVRIDASNTKIAMEKAEALQLGHGKLYTEVTPSTHHTQ